MDGTLQPQELADKSKQISAQVTALLKELDEFEFLSRVGLRDNCYARTLSQLSRDAIGFLKTFDSRMYTEVMNLLTDTDL